MSKCQIVRDNSLPANNDIFDKTEIVVTITNNVTKYKKCKCDILNIFLCVCIIITFSK